MACDICGCNTKQLETLTEMYSTKDIKQICPECMHEVNGRMRDIREMQRKMLSHLVRRFMRFKRRFKQ